MNLDFLLVEDFLQMGVVGLVTDCPEAAVEVLGGMYNLAQRTKP